MKTAILVAALAVAALAPTAHAGQLDLNLNLASVHTEQWARRSLNQRNPGAGLTYHWSRTWAVMGGEYLNSYRRPTWYAAAVWTPVHIGAARRWHVDAGLAAGLASGYGHAHYDTHAWTIDPATATGWRLVTTRHRYMRNPYSPLMAAGIVRIAAPSGLGLNLMVVPNQGPTSSGFVGFQLAIPIGGAP